MKTARQNKILEIIDKQEIESQGQLIDALKAEGVDSTQATISRDIKALRLVKELGSSGKYRYMAAGRDESSGQGYDERLRRIFREAVTSFDSAQNLIVIKTLPGLAQAVCSAIDSMEIKDLVGCIGGDDTAFLAMRDAGSAGALIREFENMLGR